MFCWSHYSFPNKHVGLVSAFESKVLCHTICHANCHAILSHVLFCFVLFCVVLFCFILFCFCSVLFCFLFFSFLLFWFGFVSVFVVTKVALSFLFFQPDCYNFDFVTMKPEF